MRATAMLAGLALSLPTLALADYPHGPGLAPMERASTPPVDVCNEMLAASRAGDLDGLVARTTIYARQKIGAFDRLLLRLARGRLSQSRCVAVVEDQGDQVQVQIYAPSGNSSQMPFVREEGVWRFDQQRWEALRHQGKAPKP
jgi:hypothetical protein